MANYLIKDTTLTGLADNIRRIKNITSTMSATDMVEYLDGITVRTSSNLSASGATVTVPAGYYRSQATKSVTTATQATPSISVSTAGLITASATQTAGYVAAGTKSATKQLSVQAAKTVTPTLSEQTAVTANVYTTGAIKVAAMPTATQATPTISVNSSGLITASATQTAGYVSAGTKSGTQQLTTQAAKTVTPSDAEQTAVAAGVYTTGAVKVAAMPSVARANTTLTGAADDSKDTITYTASNNQGTGYVTGANKTATKTVTLTASGATVTASDGTASVSKSVATATQATPSATIDSSTGKVTATATQSAGYVTAGTKTGELQLTTQAAKTVTPSTSSQTAVAAGRYTTGAVTVAAIPSNYKDTSDANAAAVDIVTSKTAYVNGSKITGTNPYVKSTTDTAVNTQATLISQASTTLAGKVAGGGSSDTSDATALPTDLAAGKTAYAKGVKITGTVEETDWFEEYADGVSYSNGRVVLEGLQHAATGPQRQIVNYGARLNAAASEFGNATAADVASGKTFTSASGLKVVGTKQDTGLQLVAAPAYELVGVMNYTHDSPFGFYKSTTSGYTDYYENNNKGYDDTAAYCECYFNVWTTCNVSFNVMNNAEQNWDYGMVSPLDTAFNSDYSNALYNYKSVTHSAPVTITFNNVAPGQHHVCFRYVKDSSQSSNSDCFRFRLNAAPNTAQVLSDSAKALVRTYEHEVAPYNIRSGATILGVTGTYDNSVKSCSIEVIDCDSRAYWVRPYAGSLLYQMMTEEDYDYTMNNVACDSLFAIYAPNCWFDYSNWDYSDEITLIMTNEHWAIFAAPSTANYSGHITWYGGNG